MGVPIPIEFGGKETSVRVIASWLDSDGRDTWHPVDTAERAQELANAGKPVIVLDEENTHIAMVRPGSYDDHSGPMIAEAGDLSTQHEYNFSAGRLTAGFGSRKVRYYYAE